jgi:hypothetical protein
VDVKSAELVYEMLMGLVIPIMVSNLKKVSWPSQYKFVLVFAMSLIAAAIVPTAQVISGGDFSTSALLESLTLIFTTSQVVYRTVLRSMNYEDVLNPQSAVLSLVKEQVARYLEELDAESAKAILDPKSPHTLTVDIKEVVKENE